MRSLLSRLAIWWAALAAGLALLLPVPLGSWVAAVAVAAAALALLIGRSEKHLPEGTVAEPAPACAVEDAGRLETGATAVRSGDPAGVLDQNTLNRLCELDPNGVNRLLERVLKAFESSATRLIPPLREGLRTGDLNGVRQVAHTLRSASASIGAVKLSQLCAQIERQIRAGQSDGLDTLVKAMVAEIDVVLSVLRSLPATRA
jgi:HPt (histidine-containing phosphotransfer) domain-containing protein